MASDVRRRGGRGIDLVVYGDLALDVVVRTRHTGQPVASDVITKGISAHPGGSAANSAISAARLGATVAFVGMTGSDPVSGWLVADLAQNGVDTSFVRRVESGSAIVVAVEEETGRRNMYSHRGPASSLPYGPLPVDLVSRCRWLHLSGYSFQDEPSRATALGLMAQAREMRCPVSLDPSFHSAHEFRAHQSPVLALVDVVFPNMEEASKIAGLDDPLLSAQAIRRTGPSTVVVKMGDAGCVALSNGSVHRVAGFQVDAVEDTIGAGDAFCAGFICGRFWGLDLADSCTVANATAACAVRQVGGHTASPTFPELLDFLNTHGQMSLAQELETRLDRWEGTNGIDEERGHTCQSGGVKGAESGQTRCCPGNDDSVTWHAIPDQSGDGAGC